MDPFSKEITFIIIVSAFLLIVGIGIISLVLIYQKKQVQYLREKEELKSAFERGILESRLEIQEQTLRNISQEIHDNIGQMLSLAKMNLNTLPQALEPAVAEKVYGARDLVGKAIQDLRDLSKTLNTDFLAHIGLVAALAYETELVNKTGAATARLTVAGESFPLTPQQELVLFRICQEAIANTLKHAQATQIELEVVFEPNALRISISDNGSGFDPVDAANRQTGIGMRNMQNRAALIGAEFALKSNKGTGTHIAIRIPRLPYKAAS